MDEVSVTHGADVGSHQPAHVRAPRGVWLWSRSVAWWEG